jgi:CheY-like chemotaxis protein
MSDIVIVGDIGFTADRLQQEVDSSLGIVVEVNDEGLFLNRAERINNAKLILLDLDFRELLASCECIEAVRRWNPMVEIIGYTLSKNPDTVIHAMKAGAYCVEPKTGDADITGHYVAQIVNDLDLFAKAQSHCDKKILEELAVHVTIATELVQRRQQEGGRLEHSELYTLLPDQSSEKLREIKPTVLIVEDETALRTLISRLVTKMNCHTIVAASGNEAVAKMRAEDRVDIAILDIGLPDMKGFELIPSILEKDRHASIMMLTAFTERGVIMDCFKAGATDYLTKPFHLVQFNQTLNRILVHQRIRQFLNSGVIHSNATDIPKELLEELAEGRAENGDAVLVKEVCLFYPELRRLGMAGDTPAIQIAPGQRFHEAFVERLEGLLLRVRG